MSVQTVSFFDIYKAPEASVTSAETSEPKKKASKRAHTQLSSEDYIEACYKGRTSGGFRHNHHYVVKLHLSSGSENRCYIHSIQDATNGSESDKVMYFSNTASANRFFQAL